MPSAISHDRQGLNRGRLRLAAHAELATHALFDRLVDFRVFLQELLGVFAPLAEPLAAVGKPRAALLDDPLLDTEVQQVAGFGDPFAVHHVELGFPERGRDFVLHDLHAGAAADHDVAVLDARDTAYVHADR